MQKLERLKQKLKREFTVIDYQWAVEATVFLEFLLVLGMVLFTILKIDLMVSICFYQTFFLLLEAFIFKFLLDKKLSLLQILCIPVAVFCIVDVLVLAGGFDFQYLKKIINFFSMILFFLLVGEMKISKRLVKAVLNVNLLIAGIYLLAYLFSASVREPRWLAFHFTNPNLTGIFLLHTFMYTVLAFRFYEKRWLRILIGILIATTFVFLLMTQARGSWLAMFAFFAFALFDALFGKRIRLIKGWSLCILLIPLIFAFGYMFLAEHDLLSILSFTETSEGKYATGRTAIWGPAYEVIKKYILTGNYPKLLDEVGHSQMHNIHFDVLASYGIFVFIFFICVLYHVINKKGNLKNKLLNKTALFAFYAVIVAGTFESVLVAGGLGAYILSGGFILFFRYKDNGEELEKTKGESSFSTQKKGEKRK